MKYIVTGSTSGLGRNLAQKLCSDGHEVIGLGRNSAIGRELTSEGVEFLEVDLLNRELMKRAFKGADAVFHCAALSSPWGKYKDFYNANVIGTENVIGAMTENDVEYLMHVSTPSIYFNYKGQTNVKEDTPLPKKFANHYATTKKNGRR